MADEKAFYVLESKEETKRLSSQHDSIKDEMGGLILAPIDLTKPLRVLDSTTADGTWIRDFVATTAPVEHQLVGIDIDPTNFPQDPPAGQTYQAHGITKPWPEEWKESFDLVHQRLALMAVGAPASQMVQHLAALVKPGGWIQLIEATNELPENTTPALQNFVRVLQGICSVQGASKHLGNELAGWLKTEGFVDVQDSVCNLKLGKCNSDPRLGKQGVYSTVLAARHLAAFGKTLPKGNIPLSLDEISRMPDELEVELASVGGVFPLRVVWGRKPAS